MGLHTLGVTARVVDSQGVATETDTVLLPISITSQGWYDKLVGPPRGSVSIEPATLTIEELTTIDSSPFLNYIYFNEGASDIPAAYQLFRNQADARSFDARSLRDTLQKHHHILNILGQRLLQHPAAGIRLVGCNSNRGVERGKIDLSRSRAEAVKAYLRAQPASVKAGRKISGLKSIPTHLSCSMSLKAPMFRPSATPKKFASHHRSSQDTESKNGPLI